MPAFLKKISRKRLIITGIVILVIVLIGWLIFPKQKQETVQFATVKKANIESTVSASGTLTGKDNASLRFKVSGKIGYINVKQSDEVQAGQVIAGLDTQDLSITLQQAYNTLRSKQATAEKILDDVKDHKSDESYTQRDTRTTAEVARDNAYDAVKAAQRAFQDATLVSPISGIVTKVGPVAGQIISVSDIIAQVSSVSQIYFDADVDEADIGKVSLNQKAQVSLDAYPDKTFEGTVADILPQTETSLQGATTVTVRINLGNPQIRFMFGLNGQSSIILSEAENVLVIPQEAIRDDSTVIIKSGSGYKSVKVEVGIKSDTEAEVKSGLSEGDQVVVNPSSVKGV